MKASELKKRAEEELQEDKERYVIEEIIKRLKNIENLKETLRKVEKELEDFLALDVDKINIRKQSVGQSLGYERS